MPVTLLIALLLAFGLDSARGSIPADEVPVLLLETAGGVAAVAVLSLGFGAWVAWRISVYGYLTTQTRRLYQVGSRFLAPIALGVYAWILYTVGWGSIVSTLWGLGDWFLVGPLAILAPFLLMQLLLWCGAFLVERALRVHRGPESPPRLWDYLVLKGRNTLGMTLPVILVFLVRNDIIGRLWPAWIANPISEPIDFAVLGSMVLCVSPLFVRLAFPSRPLPDGPLRSRLEHLAKRVGFRFRDILIWDTDHGMVNACVTGVLPGFRYVLLSDDLIETLDPKEISAVFGHEIGHIAHRHLPFFGFFFVGSLGVLTLAAVGISGLERWIISLPGIAGLVDPSWSDLIQTGMLLVAVSLFFGLAFGHLSRRFERQADLFGCMTVSCGHLDCPPHTDPDSEPADEPAASLEACEVEKPADQVRTRTVAGRVIPAPCPAGIRIFANALGRVARHNGMEIKARSWRHGSIANRIAFLESLRNDPGRERQFQNGLSKLRLRWGILLVVAMLLAMGSQVFSITL